MDFNQAVFGRHDNTDTEFFFKLMLALLLLGVSLGVTVSLLRRFDPFIFFTILFVMSGESWWTAWQPTHLAGVCGVCLFPLLQSKQKGYRILFFFLIGLIAPLKYVTLALPFALVSLDALYSERTLKTWSLNCIFALFSGIFWLLIFDTVYDDFEMVRLSFTLDYGTYTWELSRAFKSYFIFCECATPSCLSLYVFY